MTFFEWLDKGGEAVDALEALLFLLVLGVFYRLSRDP